ncbi:MAG: cytochrome c [Bacteroidales bacterium]
MLKSRQISTRLTVFFLLVPLLFACDRTRTMRGYDFIPDMAYSRAYETFSQNPNFSDSSTMRVPQVNTVPRGYLPFRYTIDPEERIRAGRELQNPFPPTEEVVARGQFIFTTFCIGCHGIKGVGDGQLYLSGLYPLKPRTLTGAVARKLKDGELFHTETLGFGSMGAHGAQIKPDDRWKLVRYIRKLQENALITGDTAAILKP